PSASPDRRSELPLQRLCVPCAVTTLSPLCSWPRGETSCLILATPTSAAPELASVPVPRGPRLVGLPARELRTPPAEATKIPTRFLIRGAKRLMCLECFSQAG